MTDKSSNFDSNSIIDDPVGTAAAPGPYLGFERTNPSEQSTGPRIVPLTNSPNGVLTAPSGSLALVNAAGVGQLWINTTGFSVWSQLV